MYLVTYNFTFGASQSTALPAAPPRGEVTSPQPDVRGGRHRRVTSPSCLSDAAAMSHRTFVAHVSGMKPSDLRCWGRGASAGSTERRREPLNGSGPGRVRPGLARMGCTVSFICCEEDFLQMHQHEVEEKTKENLTKVRVLRYTWGSARSQPGHVCLRLCAGILHQMRCCVFMLNMDEDKIAWTFCCFKAGVLFFWQRCFRLSSAS